MPAPVHEIPACGPPPSADGGPHLPLPALPRQPAGLPPRARAAAGGAWRGGPCTTCGPPYAGSSFAWSSSVPPAAAPPGWPTQLRRQLEALGRVRNAQIQLQLLGDGPPMYARISGPARAPEAPETPSDQGRQPGSLESDKAAAASRPGVRASRARARGSSRACAGWSTGRSAGHRLTGAATPGSGPADEQTLHRARVLSRECCHVIEALRPCWRGQRADELLASLRALHRAAGRIHDRELLLRRMGRLAADGRLQARPHGGLPPLSGPGRRPHGAPLAAGLAGGPRDPALPSGRFSPLARTLNPCSIQQWTTGPSP